MESDSIYEARFPLFKEMCRMMDEGDERAKIAFSIVINSLFTEAEIREILGES